MNFDIINEVFTTCGFCKYWKQFDNLKDSDPANGNCRRFPPTVTLFGNRLPVTNASDSCGEFISKPVSI